MVTDRDQSIIPNFIVLNGTYGNRRGKNLKSQVCRLSKDNVIILQGDLSICLPNATSQIMQKQAQGCLISHAKLDLLKTLEAKKREMKSLNFTVRCRRREAGKNFVQIRFCHTYGVSVVAFHTLHFSFVFLTCLHLVTSSHVNVL